MSSYRRLEFCDSVIITHRWEKSTENCGSSLALNPWSESSEVRNSEQRLHLQFTTIFNLFLNSITLQGIQMHSHDYKDFEGFKDKRNFIVGLGNSGGDIAVELGRCSKQVSRLYVWILNLVDFVWNSFCAIGVIITATCSKVDSGSSQLAGSQRKNLKSISTISK